MKILSAALVVALSTVAFSGGQASAHHAFSMYDNSKYVPLTGTIKTYSWKNPHVMIDYVAVGANGEPEAWSVECSSPNIIGRHGLTRSSGSTAEGIDRFNAWTILYALIREHRSITQLGHKWVRGATIFQGLVLTVEFVVAR